MESTKASGAGGKRNGREGGYAMSTIRVVNNKGTMKLKVHAIA